MRHPAEPILNALTFLPEREIVMTPAEFGAAYEDLYFTAADGVRINAWLVRAQKPVGHILFAHGNGGNIGDRSPVLALLAAAGFDVLIFDYRGYGRSGGRPGERGAYLDARAAREELLRQPGIDTERVLYLGKSLGGAVMIELATAFPPVGMILMSTFTGLRDAARAVYPFLPTPFVPNAFPSLRRIRTLHVPMLIMHGDNDELLPVRMAHQLYNAAPGPKQLKIYPGGAHNDLVLSPDWAETVAEWARPVLGSRALEGCGE
ncbi:alpha/beta hydrolase [Nocardia transvalensis]|uniref:alpha/beta hydrolase n=1 Tax=Nocardia transvalensis TaxID=37333 RepID=UPI001896319A|nr:alpha/beta hydrolase [Nocardia transvalensis]MBF6329939.1 alpha/beta fold hydrolase [Nocardia transvalensis]